MNGTIEERDARKARNRLRYRRRYARIGGLPVYTRRMLREARHRAMLLHAQLHGQDIEELIP
jgi:hypothetical protein